MRVVIEMDHLTTDPKSGRYKYRRRVPKGLVSVLGKREFSISLKTKDKQDAARRYCDVHEAVENEIAAARMIDPEMKDYEAQIAVLRKHGLTQGRPKTLEPIRFNDDPRSFDDFTKAALGARSSAEFDQIVEAKYFGMKRPDIRIRQVVDAYLEDRRNQYNNKNLTNQTSLVVSLIAEVMGEENPVVRNIGIEAAYEFRNALRGNGLSYGTVKRRVGTIKAILNYGVRRFEIDGYANPFNNLEVPKLASEPNAKDSRLPLSLDEIKRCNEFILSKNKDIQNLWCVLALTGARQGEILSLERQDVVLDHKVPHIHIRFNSLWRIKGEVSERKVPIIGPALRTLEERLADAEGKKDQPLFPRYAPPNGPDAASTLMRKAMVQAGVWVELKKVPYSLRHSHKDWLDRVAPRNLVDRVHGHRAPGSAGVYGGDDMLDLLHETMIRGCTESGIIDLMKSQGFGT
ncbi:DUF6538 domain-containing protein [Ruegeria sp. MALMAid1280]|uniref:DUF6538 domain-containing protein n=1 Tax=Ruegeria sp. MALMAid1280 TaxID=3411634 RepID=UPI003BA125BD